MPYPNKTGMKMQLVLLVRCLQAFSHSTNSKCKSPETEAFLLYSQNEAVQLTYLLEGFQTPGLLGTVRI